MEAISNIITSQTVKSWAFVLICATLPWIGLVRISTFLWIPLGLLCVFSGWKYLRSISFYANPLLLVFLCFYALQVIGFLVFPESTFNVFSLEQKASFLFLPILLSLLIRLVPGVWYRGVKAFITGTAVALFYSLILALISFSQNHDSSIFFYHYYSKAINANAIYASLYVCIAMYALLFYYQQKKIHLPFIAFLFLMLFFYCNLLLLSSKMIILIGSVLLACLLWLTISSFRWKAICIGGMTLIMLLIFSYNNPVKERFAHLNIEKYKVVLEKGDFTNYPFTGFDLRLLLWRMGMELLQEDNCLFWGAGGRRYHTPLNQKMLAYNMYAGKQGTTDIGYMNYDLHNQYMENTVQFGLVGLLVLCLLLGLCIIKAMRQKQWLFLIISLLFTCSFLSESVLETQSGIMLFTIFIAGEWELINLKKKKYG